MSNPSKQPNQPLSEIQQKLSRAVEYATGVQVGADRYRAVEVVVKEVASRSLDMRLGAGVPSVVIPRSHTLDVSILQAKKDVLARSDIGPLTLRTRSGPAVELAQRLAEDGGLGRYLEEVKERASKTTAAWGGAQTALGRILEHYPRRNSEVGLVPPSTAEVASAYVAAGLKPAYGMRVLGLTLVRLNRMAETGFPINSRCDNVAALKMGVELAQFMRERMEQAVSYGDGYDALLREYPHLLLNKGKAKYDVYKIDKIKDHKLRFYSVVGLQTRLIMQQATQPLEMASGVLTATDFSIRTTQGFPLVHGGYKVILERLENEVDARRRERRGAGRKGPVMAFLHCGDDCVLLIEVSGVRYVVTLDATAFDLTQHADVTGPIHSYIRAELDRIDPISSEVWYRNMRVRRTTISGAVVAELRHAGPSGSPLQSKVNDMLMDVFLSRVRVLVESSDPDPDDLAHMGWVKDAVDVVASELGLKVRVEGFTAWDANAEFVFLGYTFRHVPYAEERVQLYADIPRMVAQLPYPSTQGWKAGAEFEGRMALKMAGVLLSAGPLPLVEPERVYGYVRERLARARQELTAQDVEEAVASYEVMGLKPDLVYGLEGLMNSLTPEKVSAIWTAPRPEAPVGLWADELEEGVPVGTSAASMGVIKQRAKFVAPVATVGTAANVGRLPAKLRFKTEAKAKVDEVTDPRRLRNAKGGGHGKKIMQMMFDYLDTELESWSEEEFE